MLPIKMLRLDIIEAVTIEQHLLDPRRPYLKAQQGADYEIMGYSVLDHWRILRTF